MNQRPAARRRPLAGSPFAATPALAPRAALSVSDRVLHDRHGMGRVAVVEDETTAQVDFGSAGRRRVRIATLTVL